MTRWKLVMLSEIATDANDLKLGMELMEHIDVLNVIVTVDTHHLCVFLSAFSNDVTWYTDVNKT